MEAPRESRRGKKEENAVGEMNEGGAGRERERKRPKQARDDPSPRSRTAETGWREQMWRRIIAIRTIKYITHDFTAALLRREHRRPPVLLPGATSGHHSRNDRRPL